MTKEVRLICSAVSSTASIRITTSGRSLDVSNKTKGMAFLLCSLQHEIKFKTKHFDGMYEFNL